MPIASSVVNDEPLTSADGVWDLLDCFEDDQIYVMGFPTNLPQNGKTQKVDVTLDVHRLLRQMGENPIINSTTWRNNATELMRMRIEVQAVQFHRRDDNTFSRQKRNVGFRQASQIAAERSHSLLSEGLLYKLIHGRPYTNRV